MFNERNFKKQPMKIFLMKNVIPKLKCILFKSICLRLNYVYVLKLILQVFEISNCKLASLHYTSNTMLNENHIIHSVRDLKKKTY